ncbi:MAG: hypothetical protein L6R28_17560 [Planctomycetes bacterium]|nr:hypothetical protein [Planctomycetota bacterium]
MTDSPPRKRAWFQLHLSTCIVLMVVVGCLVWANLQTYPASLMVRNDGQRVGFLRNESSWEQGIGWPGCFYLLPMKQSDLQSSDQPQGDSGWKVPGAWDGGHLIGNLMIASIVLICTAYICEWLIRRRRRAPTPQE